ncbi:MAG: SprB repeat-containing protein, partial [Bacteroidota bacterium]
MNVTASGNGQLTYSINNGSSSQNSNLFQNIGAGTYNILVTDTNGCTTTTSSTLIEPAALASSTSTMPSICDGGTNGSATVSAQGGTAPYSYSWSSGSSTSITSNVTAGTYTVTITDANGCTLTQSAVVSNIPSPQISLITTTNNTCYQQGDGAANIVASSGTSPYKYDVGSGSISNNGLFEGFLAGTYSIIVTDANGCTSDSIFSIGEPLPIAINSTISGSICSGNNGTISLTANGGTAPYQFSNNNGSTYQSSNVFSNLIAGNYPISIIDANGCMLSQSLSLIDSPGPVVLSVSSTNVSCNGYTDGIIAIATTSGTAPLSYQINNGTPQLGSQFIALPAGNYNILVADANGCT